MSRLLILVLRKILGLDDPHCGGCAFNCHLEHPRCATGRERAGDFYRKHPEMRADHAKQDSE